MDRAAHEFDEGFVAALAEVAELGAPAQRALAIALIAQPSEARGAAWHEQARLIVDAFRNDPHLWR